MTQNYICLINIFCCFSLKLCIILGGEAISKYDYTYFGRVTEFKYGMELGIAFQGGNPIHWLKNFGEEWGLMPDGDGLVFIDNHDNQRHGGDNVLNYKKPRAYKVKAFIFIEAYIMNVY